MKVRIPNEGGTPFPAWIRIAVGSMGAVNDCVSMVFQVFGYPVAFSFRFVGKSDYGDGFAIFKDFFNFNFQRIRFRHFQDCFSVILTPSTLYADSNNYFAVF